MYKLINALILTAAVTFGAGVIAAVVIEFMAGCGEVTYYGDGTWETNKCVFSDNEIERGTW